MKDSEAQRLAGRGAVADANRQSEFTKIRPNQDGTAPWGIFASIKPDTHGNYSVLDLPRETYEPPSTPKGKLRSQINRLTIDF